MAAPAKQKITTSTLLSLLGRSDGFFCLYQPILSLKDGRVYGYEALARFRGDLARLTPDKVFAAAHQQRDLLFLLESRSKEQQIRNAPSGCRLFVNIDPHTCTHEYQIQHWIRLLTMRPDVRVHVEITENLGSVDLQALEVFIDWLKEFCIPCGLDDLGASEELIPLQLMKQVDFLKLDRGCIAKSAHDPHSREFLVRMIEFGRVHGKMMVMEGIEEEWMLELAGELSVQCVQGFFCHEGMCLPALSCRQSA